MVAACPENNKLLDVRPHMHIGGSKRRAPNLTSSCGFPLLRYKKPQPKNLSRILRYKITSRSKLLDQLEALNCSALRAFREDEWDTLVAEHMDIKDEDCLNNTNETSDPFVEEPRWAKTHNKDLFTLHASLISSREKVVKTSRAMLNILRTERRLVRLEAREWR